VVAHTDAQHRRYELDLRALAELDEWRGHHEEYQRRGFPAAAPPPA